MPTKRSSTKRADLSPTLQRQAKSFQDFWQTVKNRSNIKTSSDETQALVAKALKEAGYEVDLPAEKDQAVWLDLAPSVKKALIDHSAALSFAACASSALRRSCLSREAFSMASRPSSVIQRKCCPPCFMHLSEGRIPLRWQGVPFFVRAPHLQAFSANWSAVLRFGASCRSSRALASLARKDFSRFIVAHGNRART
jgi:hypothetical protein